MNLNQSAHGDREFGFIGTRMRRERTVVWGTGRTRRCSRSLPCGCAPPAPWHDGQGMKVARLRDNMREVAVTEGDKVEAQLRFGYDVHGFGIGDLVARVR